MDLDDVGGLDDGAVDGGVADLAGGGSLNDGYIGCVLE